MKNNIKEHIKETLSQDVPDVLDKIKASPDFYIPEKSSVFSVSSLLNRKIAISFMSLFVIALIVIGVNNRYNNPVVASTITIDVNPSIEITLDDDDLVIDVTALNDDGEEIVSKDVSYLGMTLDEIISLLVEKLGERGYIINNDLENNIVLIDVESKTNLIQERVELALKQKLDIELSKYGANHWVLNAKEINLTQEQREALLQDARQQMYTRAKLVLIYRIVYLDSSYSVDVLVQKTVQELYSIYIELEDPDNLPYYDQMPGHSPHHQEPFGENQTASII